MKPANRFLLCLVLVFASYSTAEAQSTFDATYDFGSFSPQEYYSSAPDGEGGYRVFRFNYYWPDNTQGIAGVHLDSAGDVLDVSLYAGSELGIPEQAFRMPDSTTVLLVYNSILRLGPSGEVISLTTLHTEGNLAIMRIAPVGNEVYVAINTYRNSPSGHVLLTLVKLGTDGAILQQRSYRNDIANFRTGSLMAVPGKGPVLVGRTFMVPCKVAILAFDSTFALDWAKTGPEISYESNVPVQIKPLPEGNMAVIWDADLPALLGGVLSMDTAGGLIGYHTHTMSNVGDAEPLSDGGWLFLQAPAYPPALIRHFSPDGALLGSGTVSGLYIGQVHRSSVLGWWDVLSGTTDAELSMAHFNLDEGTCLAPPNWAVSMNTDSVQLQSLQFDADTTEASALAGTCMRYPSTVTRIVHCGNVGVAELKPASNVRCQQIETHGQGISVALHWDHTDLPEFQLLDAMGRLLPSTDFQWEARGAAEGVLHLQHAPASGLGVLRIIGKQASTSCKLVFGNR